MSQISGLVCSFFMHFDVVKCDFDLCLHKIPHQNHNHIATINSTKLDKTKQNKTKRNKNESFFLWMVDENSSNTSIYCNNISFGEVERLQLQTAIFSETVAVIFNSL